ncbi:hypothetical protein [Novosphingobium sp. PC22D]|uniref:hypothetical protein n=1 Tax=Novosphingobium sp. PC22D TaxID=1962403 RepID=UPI001F0A541F|nr:hypothetical protein [Novosphingobium sp. PC22D]
MSNKGEKDRSSDDSGLHSDPPSGENDQAIGKVRVREVVGTVFNHSLLESMVSELTTAGFDRSDIDLMASWDTIRQQLPTIYPDPAVLSEIPDLPRRKLVTDDEEMSVTGLVFGTLITVSALAVGAPVVASGGALAAVVAASTGGGLLGAALANAVRKILTKGMDPETLERDLWRGGLVVFVRARAAEAEERAQAIMRRNGARNVHVHEIELKKTLDDLPLARIQPDPWLD